MRILVRALAGLFAIVVIAAAVVYFNLDRIVKREVEKQGTASLRLKVTLGSARLSVFGGRVDLRGLTIASPQGFSAPHMLELGEGRARVDYRELRNQPIHIRSLEFDQPKLVLEQSGGTLNFKKAMALQPARPPDNKPPMKLVIDQITVRYAHVLIRPGLPGISQQIDVPVQSLTLKAVGSGKGANNGAAMKDVAMQVMTALAGKAAQSDQLPAELKALLHLDTAQIATQLGADAAKEIGVNVGGDPTKVLQGLLPSGKASEPSEKHR
jgi:uncharacterized protein involved in outer membrane biogenesis